MFMRRSEKYVQKRKARRRTLLMFLGVKEQTMTALEALERFFNGTMEFIIGSWYLNGKKLWNLRLVGMVEGKPKDTMSCHLNDSHNKGVLSMVWGINESKDEYPTADDNVKYAILFLGRSEHRSLYARGQYDNHDYTMGDAPTYDSIEELMMKIMLRKPHEN